MRISDWSSDLCSSDLVTDKLDAYEHKGPWQNRMVLGDSTLLMSSMLELEGLGGQVQMVYMAPPYGVKFGSNFQPFVRDNDMGELGRASCRESVCQFGYI